MVRCLDCYNFVEVFFPAEIKGVMSDAKWRCTATGKAFTEYYLLEIERECLHKKTQHP